MTAPGEHKDSQPCAEVVITHTVQDGTTLTGLEEMVRRNERTVLIDNGWSWSGARSCWYLPQTRGYHAAPWMRTVDMTSADLGRHGYKVKNLSDKIPLNPHQQPIRWIINPDAADPENPTDRRRRIAAKILAYSCVAIGALIGGWAFIRWGTTAADLIFDKASISNLWSAAPTPTDEARDAWPNGFGDMVHLAGHFAVTVFWFGGIFHAGTVALHQIHSRWSPNDYGPEDVVNVSTLAPQWATQLVELERTRRADEQLTAEPSPSAHSIWGLAAMARSAMALQSEVETIVGCLGPNSDDSDVASNRLIVSVESARGALCDFNTAFNRAVVEVNTELTEAWMATRAGTAAPIAATPTHPADLEVLTTDLRHHIESLKYAGEGRL